MTCDPFFPLFYSIKILKNVIVATALKKRGDPATNVELRMLKNSYHNYVKLVLSPTHLNPTIYLLHK